MSKFFYFLLVPVLLFPKVTSAQKFRAGFIAGTVASDLAGINPNNNSFRKAGFTFGGILSTSVSGRNTFHFEILYTQKGSLQKADSTNNFNYYRLRLDYIEVPIVFKHQLQFNLTKNPVDRFALEMGLSGGSLTRIRQDNTFNNTYNNDLFKKAELAAIVGLNITIVDNLMVNVRYSNSLISVIKRPELLNSFFWYTFNKGNNMVFYFTIRYLLKTRSDKE